MNETSKNEILQPGQPLFIADGAILADAIAGVVSRVIADYEVKKAEVTEVEETMEQHAAAEMLGKHVSTLARWAKAGLIKRVPDTLGRDVYYYISPFMREKAAKAAKKDHGEL